MNMPDLASIQWWVHLDSNELCFLHCSYSFGDMLWHWQEESATPSTPPPLDKLRATLARSIIRWAFPIHAYCKTTNVKSVCHRVPNPGPESVSSRSRKSLSTSASRFISRDNPKWQIFIKWCHTPGENTFCCPLILLWLKSKNGNRYPGIVQHSLGLELYRGWSLLSKSQKATLLFIWI